MEQQPNNDVDQPTATDIIAFAVVELNTVLPYEVLLDMSPTSDLYQSILEHWRRKQDREIDRFAMIACTIANCNGNKTKPRDFYRPISSKAAIDEVKAKESAIRNMFMRHNARLQANQ